MSMEKELAEARARNSARLDKPEKTPAQQAAVLAFREAQAKRPNRAKCSICGDVVSGREIHLDHNHQHGYLRAWLCHRCNSGLGMFREDPFIMGKAIEYIAHYKLLYESQKTG